MNRDEIKRRFGYFPTPQLHTDLAHQYVSEVFGSDWKEKFVVWDCCCGTGNLTKDYKFRELYLSTIKQDELDFVLESSYNPGAIKFQFDFLNDSDDKLPQGLRDAINNGKDILFLLNPPYAEATNMKTDRGTGKHKTGVAKTLMNEEMAKQKWGRSSSNLYGQFLYRIWKYQEVNKNIRIGLFCNSRYLTGSGYKTFRERFFKRFDYKKGFLFQASHFSGVSAKWGISFAVYDNQVNKAEDFKHDLFELKDGKLLEKGEKVIYNVDRVTTLSKWVREPIKKMKTFDTPQLTSALKVKSEGCLRGSLVEDALGYMLLAANDVGNNANNVCLLTSAYSGGNGLSVVIENFDRVCTTFTARKSIKGNWINDTDEYSSPNIEHTEYNQFEIDSIVYLLFNNSSEQSSLRQVTYKDKKYDIKNEFFWMSRKEMMELADIERVAFDEDAKMDKDRFVYKRLFVDGVYNQLSPDARAVLDKASDLVRKSIKERNLMSIEHPGYHLSSWDAGFAQLKLVWKVYFKEEFEKFRELYSKLEQRLIPLVYELGFLK